MRQMLWSFATIRVFPCSFRLAFERAIRTLEPLGDTSQQGSQQIVSGILSYCRQFWTSTRGPLAQLAEQRTLNPIGWGLATP